MARNCQNCQTLFEIASEDLEFYEKIQVPPPTWCPDCRFMRRFTWRNERTLFKRKCDAPGHEESILSIFSPESGRTVYDNTYWFSDSWNPLDYGVDYDFSKPFFLQFQELMHRVPHFARLIQNATNAEYANWVVNSKNIYLAFSSINSEDVMYSTFIDRSRQILDSFDIADSELLYECRNAKECYRGIYLVDCRNCIDSSFLFDCVNCSNCILCTNLRNASYCIENQQYTKEDFIKKTASLNLTTWIGLTKSQQTFNTLKQKAIHRYTRSINTVNATGDLLRDCKDVAEVFYGEKMERCKYIYRGVQALDSMDGNGVAGSLMYECGATGFGNSNCSFHVMAPEPDNFHYEYTFMCGGSQNLFGCVSIRKKQNCILNKQYSEKEYTELRKRIIEHMNTSAYVDHMGRVYKYGEFFPPELSPFAYNESVAIELYSKSKEEIENAGWIYRAEEAKNHTPTMQANKLEDAIENVQDSITNEVIECAKQGKKCTKAFKVTEKELEFYKNLRIPLPRACPNCRNEERMNHRNPLKLWERQCMCEKPHSHHAEKCQNTIKTTYAPERPEIIYCEQCYQQEII